MVVAVVVRFVNTKNDNDSVIGICVVTRTRNNMSECAHRVLAVDHLAIPVVIVIVMVIHPSTHPSIVSVEILVSGRYFGRLSTSVDGW